MRLSTDRSYCSSNVERAGRPLVSSRNDVRDRSPLREDRYNRYDDYRRRENSINDHHHFWRYSHPSSYNTRSKYMRDYHDGPMDYSSRSPQGI